MNYRGITRAAGTALVNCLRTSYLRSIAHTSADWQWSSRPTRVRCLSLDSMAPGLEDVRLSLAAETFGETPVTDMLALCTLVSKRQPQTLFEFGTFTGNTTLNLAMNMPASGRILTLDYSERERKTLGDTRWETSFDQRVIGRRFRETCYAERITQIFSDSYVFDAAPYMGTIDLVYVDACHEYEAVLNDSTKAFQMLSEDGLVVWHDYCRQFPGVCRYLDDLARSRDVFWIEGTKIAFCPARAPDRRR